MIAVPASHEPIHTRALTAWVFWIALYAACVAAGRLVTPGLPEAVGFAFAAFAPAALAAWLVRRRSPVTRRLLATGVAVVLTVGAMTGTLGQTRDRRGDVTLAAASST